MPCYAPWSLHRFPPPGLSARRCSAMFSAPRHSLSSPKKSSCRQKELASETLIRTDTTQMEKVHLDSCAYSQHYSIQWWSGCWFHTCVSVPPWKWDNVDALYILHFGSALYCSWLSPSCKPLNIPGWLVIAGTFLILYIQFYIYIYIYILADLLRIIVTHRNRKPLSTN